MEDGEARTESAPEEVALPQQERPWPVHKHETAAEKVLEMRIEQEALRLSERDQLTSLFHSIEEYEKHLDTDDLKRLYQHRSSLSTVRLTNDFWAHPDINLPSMMQTLGELEEFVSVDDEAYTSVPSSDLDNSASNTDKDMLEAVKREAETLEKRESLKSSAAALRRTYSRYIQLESKLSEYREPNIGSLSAALGRPVWERLEDPHIPTREERMLELKQREESVFTFFDNFLAEDPSYLRKHLNTNQERQFLRAFAKLKDVRVNADPWDIKYLPHVIEIVRSMKSINLAGSSEIAPDVQTPKKESSIQRLVAATDELTKEQLLDNALSALAWMYTIYHRELTDEKQEPPPISQDQARLRDKVRYYEMLESEITEFALEVAILELSQSIMARVGKRRVSTQEELKQMQIIRHEKRSNMRALVKAFPRLAKGLVYANLELAMMEDEEGFDDLGRMRAFITKTESRDGYTASHTARS